MSSDIGIGLTGQMHGATILSKDNEILCPCMLSGMTPLKNFSCNTEKVQIMPLTAKALRS
ncbi:hypothetical protein [Cocleimonas flava]|uniref:hypothetical protein n=1 Tax=Cocleimonas flava TaxID=634765 RepID=UPI001051C56A|nr:hypothetical protein [Cocleimonas flava]